jgi:hypothetical protein
MDVNDIDINRPYSNSIHLRGLGSDLYLSLSIQYSIRIRFIAIPVYLNLYISEVNIHSNLIRHDWTTRIRKE